MPSHPEMPEEEKKHQERRAHDRAMEDTLKTFLDGQLMDKDGNEIDSRKEAMLVAEANARKAVQNLKKEGVKFDVFAHSR